MEFFNKDPVVKVGDAVSTSNFSQLFPPGLPIGKVVALNLNKSPAPEAIIELTAPLAFLETVVVYPHKPLSDNQPDLP
jgi:rod shape-determining protein MreC